MEKLSIKTPDDFIALMGHSLGFWPQESLVCILLDGRRIGASLRPTSPPPPPTPPTTPTSFTSAAPGRGSSRGT